MYEGDFAKEFMRKQFHDGTLDVTASVEDLMSFCRIFAGEVEALQAIRVSSFLSAAEVDAALKAAQPTRQTQIEFDNWLAGI